MSEVVLKLTTKRALEFEERTGKDLLVVLEQVAKSGEIGIKDILELYKALGENYTLETFDAWEVPLAEKIKAIMNAIKEYTQGKN